MLRALAALLLLALALGLVRHLTRDEAAAHCGGPDPGAEVWQPRADSRELVLMLHAFTREPGSLCQVRAVLAEQTGQPGADLWIPALPFGTFSQVPLDAVTTHSDPAAIPGPGSGFATSPGPGNAPVPDGGGN